MYKIISLLFIILFLITACSTTGFLGLAKESYVKQIENKNDQLKEENEELKENLKNIKEDMDKVLDLTEEIEDLEELTRELESKLDELPEETLRKIVLILQQYLNEKDRDEE